MNSYNRKITIGKANKRKDVEKNKNLRINNNKKNPIFPAALAASSPEYLVLLGPLRPKQLWHLHTWSHWDRLTKEKQC